jgi:hypothetical protein
VVIASHDRRGASRLGCLFQILIVAAIAYVALIAGEEALNYYRFKDAMRNEAYFAATRSDADIKSHLRAFTDSLKLPPDAKNIKVARQGNHIRIWSEYDQVFEFPFNYTKVVHLRPSAEKSF